MGDAGRVFSDPGLGGRDIGQVFDLASPGFEGLVIFGEVSGVWQREAASVGERPLSTLQCVLQ